MLDVQQLTVSPFASNCYLITDPDRNETIIVDPGDDPEVILEAVDRLGTQVVAIWNTHGHIDHINANAPVKAATNAPITIHEIEKDWLGSAELSLAAPAGIPFRPSKADHLWQPGTEFEALGRTWVARHTPGHSPGSCVLICDEEKLIAGGDLIMQDSIGRMDLPGGNATDMESSLKRVFSEWAKDDYTVLCGHGPTTTIGRERQSNGLVRAALSGRLAGMV